MGKIHQCRMPYALCPMPQVCGLYSASQLDALQIISSRVGGRHCRALTSVLDSTDNCYSPSPPTLGLEFPADCQ